MANTFSIGEMVASLKANTKDYSRNMQGAIKETRQLSQSLKQSIAGTKIGQQLSNVSNQIAKAFSSSRIGQELAKQKTLFMQHGQVLKTVFANPQLAKGVQGLGVNMAAGLGKASQALSQVSPLARNMGGAIKAASGVAVAGLSAVAVAAAALVAGLGVVAGIFAAVSIGAFKLADAAAPVEGVKRAFMGLASEVEGGGEAMLAAMQKATYGMVDNMTLMQQWNKAAQLVSVEFAEKLPAAMELINKVAASTGEDVGFMMNSLTVGIGRLSPMILDNLGIQVKLTDAYQAWADKMGVAAESMTKAQQQTALMDFTLQKLAENTANMPSVFGSAQQVFQAFRTDLKNIRDDVGMDLLPTFTQMFVMFRQFMPAIKAFGQGFAGAFAGIVQVAKSVLQGLGRAMGIDFNAIANNSESWGENIVMSLARGMVNAIGAVISALNTLGSIIANWLAPGSPPKLLPNLPQWGMSAANEFLNGMTMADVSILRDLSSQVQAFLQSTMAGASQQALAEAVLAARQAIEQAIASGGDLMSAVPAELQAYTSALLQVEAAAQAVAEAEARVAEQQQAVADAQAHLNQITQRYEQALSPISARLAEIQKERDDFVKNQRRTELQDIIEQATAAGDMDAVHFAQLELEELDLQDQQQALEEQQAAEEAAAQAAIDSAEEQLTAEQQALEAAQAAADAAEEQLQLQQELLAHQIETNNLMAQMLETLNATGGAAGGAAGGVGSLTEALENMGGAGMGAVGNLGSSISALAQQIIDEFATLAAPATELGTTWGGVFTTITGRITTFVEDIKTRYGEIKTQFNEVKTELGLLVTDWTTRYNTMKTNVQTFVADIIAQYLALKTDIETKLAGIRLAWDTATTEIKNKWVNDTWPAIDSALQTAWTSILGVFQEIDRWVNVNLVPWFNLMRDTWVQIWTDIATALTTQYDTYIKPRLEDIEEWLNDKLTKAVEDIKELWDTNFQAIADKINSIKGDILAFFDRVEAFANWLKTNVFTFEVHLPDLPDWAIPGSPLPIHTAWRDFERFLETAAFSPDLDFGGLPAGVRAGLLPAGAGAAGAQSAPFAENVNINNGMDYAEFRVNAERWSRKQFKR